MVRILRRRRFRLIVCIALIIFLALLVKNIKDYFITQPLDFIKDRIELRKFPSNFDIISPVFEPRGYSEQSLFLLVIVSTSLWVAIRGNLSHFRCLACWVVEFDYKCPFNTGW